MAVSLNLGFTTSGDKKLSVTYPYANPSALAANVKTLMETMVDNSEIFSEPPVSIVDANFVERNVTPISLA
ncbi:hypothetical protein FACS1894187_04810 [Synergistales bacterium]|nr:hypothetical protein FACS1894187_04810 [Synergistales bacterium]